MSAVSRKHKRGKVVPVEDHKMPIPLIIPERPFIGSEDIASFYSLPREILAAFTNYIIQSAHVTNQTYATGKKKGTPKPFTKTITTKSHRLNCFVDAITRIFRLKQLNTTFYNLLVPKLWDRIGVIIQIYQCMLISTKILNWVNRPILQRFLLHDNLMYSKPERSLNWGEQMVERSDWFYLITNVKLKLESGVNPKEKLSHGPRRKRQRTE